jgi:hypothetical protein
MSLSFLGIVIAVIATYVITRSKYRNRYRDKFQQADTQRINAMYCPPPQQKLHIYTVATRPDPGLDALVASCRRKGLGLHVLGHHNRWQGFGNKYLWTAEYLDLQKLPDDDVMVFIDAFDVLTLADEQEILQKFRASGARIIYTAEKNCYPDVSLADRHPASPTPFRYLNSGGGIGYVADMRAMIAAINFKTTDVDQHEIMLYCLNHPDKIVLDTQCEFFLPLFAVEESELKVETDTGRVLLLQTNQQPCFLHGNGPSIGYLNELGKRLGIA